MSEASAPGGSLLRLRGPELALLIVALAMFTARLGAMDLWGKREQRAVAEALNTVDEHNWLVAQIQSRPRLEKPPLPRWTSAALMTATGRRDQWLLRLPSALAALGMVGLVYGLGRRMAGREAGLAAGLILASSFFFVVESRQAGNDGPLAFFTTLAIYAAFRRLHGAAIDDPPGEPADRLGARGWATLTWAALGLGFLSKGPVVLMLVGLAVVPYLLVARRFKIGGRALVTWQGLVAFLLLALSWPVPVLMYVPNAAKIWMLEMGQKAGAAGITHHKQRLFYREWPWMTAPWSLVATWAVLMPFWGRGRGEGERERSSVVWLPWSWTVLNFAMFCLWTVAKPNYYVPCVPGAALLGGIAWMNALRVARDPENAAASRAQRFVQVHWGGLMTVAILAPAAVIGASLSVPFLASRLAPDLAHTLIAPVVVASLGVIVGVAASIVAWRRRADSAVMAGMVGGMAVAITVGYAVVVPMFNEGRSHRVLAGALDRYLPREASTVMFYRELDEGLWYYLKGRTLAPVPGSTPKFSRAADLQEEFDTNTIIWNRHERMMKERQVLLDWLDGGEYASPYVLIRADVFDLYGPEVAKRTETIFRETEGERHNKLMLLKVREGRGVARGASAERR